MQIKDRDCNNAISFVNIFIKSIAKGAPLVNLKGNYKLLTI